jgi:transcriptional regulator with XRE-family HTH domain
MLTYCIQFVKMCSKWGDYVDVLKVFGRNLKKYRNEIGLSQEGFAKKAGLHRTYISAVECGKRSIALENVQKIAEALDVDIHILFIEDEDNIEEV